VIALRGKVLVADDEADLRSLIAEVLAEEGLAVTTAADAGTALTALREGDFDLVVSDICMPGPNGLEFLRQIREEDPDLPVLLVTGQPSLETAIQAVEHGALQYLIKPFSAGDLRAAARRGLNLRRMAALRREALDYLDHHVPEVADTGATLSRAIGSLWMAYQPIVRATDGSVYGYEALVRSAEPRLPDPGALFTTAERLGRVWDVSSAVRSRVAAGIRPGCRHRFLNVHPLDLGDPRLYDRAEALAERAGQVVLEITERATLGSIPDLRGKVLTLRDMGFRIAVDDLGAGYSGLSSFAALEPDVVKLDMSLVRGIDQEDVKRKLVSSMTTLCRELGVLVVAEGVETQRESEVLTELGCELLQGFYYGRPGLLPEALETIPTTPSLSAAFF
jgi:EAL domain-containing protein (putative c-di-GMP-specific phosphodiesterase class I)